MISSERTKHGVTTNLLRLRARLRLKTATLLPFKRRSYALPSPTTRSGQGQPGGNLPGVGAASGPAGGPAGVTLCSYLPCSVPSTSEAWLKRERDWLCASVTSPPPPPSSPPGSSAPRG